MAADCVKVSIKEEGEPSGLAMMMLQYFEQNISDFDYKNRQASKITGKIAIEAAEGDVGITVHFKGDEIEISEGCFPTVDMFVRGGIFDITELDTGGSGGALGKIFGGKLRIESAWKHPFVYLSRGIQLRALVVAGEPDGALAAVPAIRPGFSWSGFH